MDLRQLIAKMDQIEQRPVHFNEDAQVNEDPLLLVGLGMGLKWLWDKYQQSQDEAEAAKKAAEEAKRAGDAAEAARLAAIAAQAVRQAEVDRGRATEAAGSKCKAKVGDAEALLSKLEAAMKAKAQKAAAGPVPGPFNGGGAGGLNIEAKCKTCGTAYKDHFNFEPAGDPKGKVTSTKLRHPAGPTDEFFPGLHGKAAVVIGSGPIAQGPNGSGVAAKPAAATQYPSAKSNESFEFNSSIANALIESFGYDFEKKKQVDEWKKQDTHDTIRAAVNGATFGAGDNIRAGFKSAFGKNTYAQELERERAETEKAQARSPELGTITLPGVKIGDYGWDKKEWKPTAYDAANIAGAVAVPIPGVGLAGQVAARGVKAVAGGGKVASRVAGGVGMGTELAATYGVLKGSEHLLDKHSVTTIVKAKGGNVKLGLAQAAMGMNDTELDGKMGPLTQASLEIVQQENKLPVTGKLDIATAKVLGV